MAASKLTASQAPTWAVQKTRYCPFDSVRKVAPSSRVYHRDQIQASLSSTDYQMLQPWTTSLKEQDTKSFWYQEKTSVIGHNSQWALEELEDFRWSQSPKEIMSLKNKEVIDLSTHYWLTQTHSGTTQEAIFTQMVKIHPDQLSWIPDISHWTFLSYMMPHYCLFTMWNCVSL